MIRNYKAFGLALMAMVAFGAVMVQSASAVPLTVPSSLAKVFVTGDKTTEHVFSTPNGSVKCNTVDFHGSGAASSGAVNELTIEPTYSNCTAFGFATAHVKVNGCTYTFTTPTLVKTGEVTWDPTLPEGKGQFHIICPAEKKIEITPTSFGVSVCTQFVEAQTPTGGHLVARNSATISPMDIDLEATLKEIHYTGSKAGSVCGGPETNTNAEYNGSVTVTCFSNEARTVPVDCTIS